MSILLSIDNITQLGNCAWQAKLGEADVRRLGDPKVRVGQKSIIAVTQPRFNSDTKTLSFRPESAVVLNIGTNDDAVFIDVGPYNIEKTQPTLSNQVKYQKATIGKGDGDESFLKDCDVLLESTILGEIARLLLLAIRKQYSGKLVEGNFRKWTNHPKNFFALTIQNKDKSIAVHIKGNVTDFNATTLDIKPDRPSYCRFKITRMEQLDDATKVILSSARRAHS